MLVEDLQCCPVIEEVLDVPLVLGAGDLLEDGVGQEAGVGQVDSAQHVAVPDPLVAGLEAAALPPPTLYVLPPAGQLLQQGASWQGRAAGVPLQQLSWQGSSFRVSVGRAGDLLLPFLSIDLSIYI